MDAYLQDNRANWDGRAPIHAASSTYGIEEYVADPDHISRVLAFDLDVLGPLDGLRVAHLQCHIGTDTVSLARAGAAEVVGLDFSSASLAVARDLAERTGHGDVVSFVESDVHRAPEALGEGRFDLVYATLGVLCWIPSIADWMAASAPLLAPGGRLLLRDGHPMSWALDLDDVSRLTVAHPYFEHDEPVTWDDGTTYTDGGGIGAVTAARQHEWNHGIGEILGAALGQGLRIERYEEFDDLDWCPNPAFVRNDRKRYELPSPLHRRVPMEFRLVARRPEGTETLGYR